MNELWHRLAQCRKMLLHSLTAFSCMRSINQETPSEPVSASVPPFSQQRQDQGTRALQHSQFRACTCQSGWAETSQLLQSLSSCEVCVKKWSGRGSWGIFHSCSKPGCLMRWADQGLGHVPRHRRASSCSGRLWRRRGWYFQTFPAGGTGKKWYNGAGFVKGFHLLRNSPFCDFHACPLIPLSVSGGKQNHQQSWCVSLKIFFSMLKQNPLLTTSCPCLHRLRHFSSWFFLYSFLTLELNPVTTSYSCFS